MEETAEIEAFIQHVAKVSTAVGWQAGVGAMEMAGSIISYLAENPEALPKFMEDGSVIDWPFGWYTQGCLTWHGQDGKIYSPEYVRRQATINAMRKPHA